MPKESPAAPKKTKAKAA